MTDETKSSELQQLLEEQDQYLAVPALGDLITATVLSTKGREIRLDVNGLTTGVVRGKELFTESGDYANLRSGDKVEATVIDLENENGEVELSFRVSGQITDLPIRGATQLSEGDVVARLDPRDFETAIAQLESQRDQSMAQLAALRTGARAEEVMGCLI